MHQKNTYSKGTLSFILYPTEDGTFVAACKELCLIREEKDAELAKLEIMAKAKQYLKNVIENKRGENFLNQSLPQEIIDEFDAYRRKKQNENFQRWVEDLRKLLKNNHSLY